MTESICATAETRTECALGTADSARHFASKNVSTKSEPDRIAQLFMLVDDPVASAKSNGAFQRCRCRLRRPDIAAQLNRPRIVKHCHGMVGRVRQFLP